MDSLGTKSYAIDSKTRDKMMEKAAAGHCGNNTVDTCSPIQSTSHSPILEHLIHLQNWINLGMKDLCYRGEKEDDKKIQTYVIVSINLQHDL